MSCNITGNPCYDENNPCKEDDFFCAAGEVDIEDYKATKAHNVNLAAQNKVLTERLAKMHLENGTYSNVPANGDASSSQADGPKKRVLRSSHWFDRSDDLGMRALYMERFLNQGLTQEELLSDKPKIGIVQSGSDLTPCNSHHKVLAKRIRDGIRAAGGVPIEFPMHPIQESARRPTAALDRNLAHLGLVEIMHGYPLDGVVLTTGCDKTTPAQLMAAATMNMPAIALNVGPMLNGWSKGKRVGSGSVIWKAREMQAAGKITAEEMVDMVADGTPSAGHCNTMGTASSMNALTEALGMMLPGTSAIPAVYRERGQAAYRTGVRIVELIDNDIKPCDIMTREAFENAIVVNTAIGGSTNCPVHLIAIAKHAGVKLNVDDWDNIGFRIPLLLNMQPAGEMLSEEYHRAGGVPAIMAELLEAGALPNPDVLTVNGKTIRQNVEGKLTWDRTTIFPYNAPMKLDAGFLQLKGNLFDSAIMKTSVISPEFRAAFLENPDDPNAFTGPVAVFDGPVDYHKRLETAKITDRTIMVMRGVGPLGYPGAAEVVNMHPPSHLLQKGITSLPCIGDGRQSGTSGSPSILHCTPEAADGGNLALLFDGDKVRVDLNNRYVEVQVSNRELAFRRQLLEGHGGYHGPMSKTPWEDIFRREVDSLAEGMVFKRAAKFQRLGEKEPPRDNH